MSVPQKLPDGWDEQKLRKLAAYYDSQTEDERAAEVERALLDAELERRIALSDADPTRGVTWEEVRCAARERWSETQLSKTQEDGVVCESPRRVSIGIAGNTWFPALLALRAKGYRLWLEWGEVDDPKNPYHPYMPNYQAEKGGAYFSATTSVELLGLVAMWETRGDDWRLKAGEMEIADELMDSAKTFDSEGNELPDDGVASWPVV